MAVQDASCMGSNGTAFKFTYFHDDEYHDRMDGPLAWFLQWKVHFIYWKQSSTLALQWKQPFCIRKRFSIAVILSQQQSILANSFIISHYILIAGADDENNNYEPSGPRYKLVCRTTFTGLSKPGERRMPDGKALYLAPSIYLPSS